MANWQTQALIFGEHHKTVLAELAGVDKRTVQRWFAGTLDAPQWVIENINATHELWGWQCPTCGDSDCKQPIQCRNGDGF